MPDEPLSVGVIGGTGALGGAMVHGLVGAGVVPPGRLWVSNRSGDASRLAGLHGLRFTRNNQELVDSCGVIVLAAPPHLAPELGIDASGRLIVSVMAGVTIARLGDLTRGGRIVRAMSSPAAADGLAYSPWVAGPNVTADDRSVVTALFEACGLTDELPDEDQIDRFTALTGPTPGFVAYFAASMVEYAISRGVEARVANRAILQLFHASGLAMARSGAAPSDHVRDMIEYAGTTAAGLRTMQSSSLAELIGAGLDASYHKARSMG